MINILHTCRFFLLFIGMAILLSKMAYSEKQVETRLIKVDGTGTEHREQSMNTPQEKRLIIGIQTDTNIPDLRKKLKGIGAIEIMDEDAKVFGHLVITVDAKLDDKDLIDKLIKIQGVRYAEPDSMKYTY